MHKRAKTPEEKREVIEQIYNAWVDEPDLRLGQFIMFLNKGKDIFYKEDYTWFDKE